jgi:hypothetical protein
MSVQPGAMSGVAWDRLDIALWALIFHHATMPKLKTVQDPIWSPEYYTSVTSLAQSLQVCSPQAFVNLLLVCRAWKVRLACSNPTLSRCSLTLSSRPLRCHRCLPTCFSDFVK